MCVIFVSTLSFVGTHQQQKPDQIRKGQKAGGGRRKEETFSLHETKNDENEERQRGRDN